MLVQKNGYLKQTLSENVCHVFAHTIFKNRGKKSLNNSLTTGSKPMLRRKNEVSEKLEPC